MATPPYPPGWRLLSASHSLQPQGFYTHARTTCMHARVQTPHACKHTQTEHINSAHTYWERNIGRYSCAGLHSVHFHGFIILQHPIIGLYPRFIVNSRHTHTHTHMHTHTHTHIIHIHSHIIDMHTRMDNHPHKDMDTLITTHTHDRAGVDSFMHAYKGTQGRKSGVMCMVYICM